jgi:hypothetical protein
MQGGGFPSPFSNGGEMSKTNNFKSFEDQADEQGWMPPPEGGTCPVEDIEYLNNMRYSIGLDLPNLKQVEPHKRIMIMVCGGPTAKNYIEEIRKRSKEVNCDVFCSNKTHDWLIENGIVPDNFFMIDPKPSKVKDVQKPHKDVKYYIAAQCTPSVFDALKGYNVTRLFSFCNIGHQQKDWWLAHWLVPKEEIEPMGGGAMAGLRAMNLADVLGYRTVEFYGFDSCFFEFKEGTLIAQAYSDGKEPVFYAYDKHRAESTFTAQTASGREYLTTPVFASQARQYIKWKHRLAWIKFIIHGDSLTAQLEKEDEETGKRTTDKLITDKYKTLLRKFHAECDEYGTSGHKYVKDVAMLAGQLAKTYKSLTVLDYGSGKRTLEKAMPRILGVKIKNFDPGLESSNGFVPKPTDMVVCTDVLEHVEPECLENVLDELQRLTKKVIYISVALKPAQKELPDGRNAHLIVQPFDWWLPEIKKRFQLCEANHTDDWAIFIANKGIS